MFPFFRVPALGSVLVAGVLAWVVPAVGASPPTGSADSPSTTSALDLRQALVQAREGNFELQAARLRVEELGGEVRHAGRLTPTNPELELEYAEREAAGGETSTDRGISLSQTLWIGGQGGLARRAADARERAAQAQYRFLLTTVSARTRQAFLRLLAAQRAVATAERAATLSESLQGFARERLEAGEATRLDLNAARIGQARARGVLTQARRDAERARLDLAGLLGRDPVQRLEVRGTLSTQMPALPPDDELLREALARRADLAATAETLLAAQEELGLARRQLIPNLTVAGFYAEEEGTQIRGARLGFDLPLTHRFGGERDAATARLGQAQVERDALQFAVRQEVLAARAGFRSAVEALTALSGEALAAAEDNVELTEAALRAGKLGAPAITTAQENLLTVRGAHLSALTDLIDAAAALERATGGYLVLHDARTTHDKDSEQ